MFSTTQEIYVGKQVHFLVNYNIPVTCTYLASLVNINIGLYQLLDHMNMTTLAGPCDCCNPILYIVQKGHYPDVVCPSFYGYRTHLLTYSLINLHIYIPVRSYSRVHEFGWLYIT